MERAMLTVAEGYDRWARLYDGYVNSLIMVETPVVEGLLGELAGKRVLDVACGTGRHTIAMRARGADVIGLDPSPGMLAIAREKAPDLTFREGRADAIPEPDASFDVVLCALLMEHLPDIAPSLREMHRVLRPRRLSSRVRALVAAVGMIGCSGSHAHQTTPLASDGTHLRDAEGRIALLRGINARVQGVFDVTFSDGRTALEPIPELVAADCQRMRQLGLDLLRLPINWSAIEPTHGAFDAAYLDRVDAAIQCAGDAGMVVLVDVHQDAYSKEIGEDGAPLWAIQPAPEMLLGGPLTDLGTRRLSQQVTAAFSTFFDPTDAAGLQADYAAMLEQVASRWADDPAVLGFELFNEPVAGEPAVDAFSAPAAARVRAVAPDKLVVFEPTATRNLFDFVTPATAPFPTVNAVYAPHVYTFVFDADPTSLQNLQPTDLEPSVSAARTEATAWHTPLLIGEYGLGPTYPNADLWMGVEAELHDRYLASDAFWLWKEESQGSWGMFDLTGDTWVERPQVVAWLSRVHAARISGAVVANAYDHTTGGLRLTTTGASQPHAIYIPEAAASTFAISCDGATATAPRDPATGLVEVACGGELDVTP